MEKTSEVLNGCMEKIKVSSAEIVVHGIKDKPNYEIKYRDLSDGQIHEGYSSYNLDYVFEWLEECFEIIPEKDADRMSMISGQVHYLRSLAADQTPEALYEVFGALNEAADTIEALSAKLTDMERSAEDCGGGWIECESGKLPDKEVICCDVCGEIIIGYIHETYESEQTGFSAENNHEYMYNCVKWMEKPKP